MRVFVTGANGFIGKAVVQELLNNGHQVVGLARSDASAEAIQKAGAEVHRGDIEDLETLRTGAKASDGVIHLAFMHDFSDFEGICAVDRAAIAAMGDALAGTGKPLVIASGTMMMPKGVVAVEDAEPERGTPFAVRAKSEDLLFALSKEKNVRGTAIRLSPTVHGEGDKGFVVLLGDAAKKNGSVIMVGDGSQRWPAVHRLDAAVLFRLALEKGTAGSAYHGASEQGVTMREMLGMISKQAGVPLESKPMDEAMQALGFFAFVVSADNPTSSEKTQKELGWKPKQLELIPDIEANYFKQ